MMPPAQAQLMVTLPDLSTSGRLTRSYVRRTLLLYTLICSSGALPWLLDCAPSLQAVGWGLWFPGAGFISTGGLSLLLVPLTLVLFLVSLFLWFASGNLAAPLAVWLLSALLAGLIADVPAATAPQVIVGLTLLAGAWLLYLDHRRRHRTIARRAKRLESLPRVIAHLQQQATEHPAPAHRELSIDDLRAVRYLLERGLAPVDSLQGLEVIEQFQPAALRYQLFDLQYSLALVQCHYTPNFDGYLSQAQRNLIEKVTSPDIWSYWKWESLWGRFSTNFDPVLRDNIMLTGYYLICLGLYASNTGDRRYEQPGMLDFRLRNGQHFPHDMHSIANALVSNFEASPYCLYPCEPNWIYTFCNLQGMTGMLLYDRVVGTRHQQRLHERFENLWRQEFTELDGSIVPIRSSLTGLSIPGLVGLIADCSGSVLAGAVLPEVALRMWAQAVGENIRVRDDGTLDLTTVGADNIDPGNYQKGLGMTYTAIWLAAQEYGYPEIAQAAQRSLDREYTPCVEHGVLRYPKLSVSTNAMAVRARLMRRDDWRTAILQGPTAAARQGPRLSKVSYPDVLVARAVSNTGRDLELVLYPENQPGWHSLQLDNLVPGKPYRISGGQLDSQREPNELGQLSISAYLDGRTTIHIQHKI